MQGNRHQQDGLVIYWAPNGLQHTRCGIAIKAKAGKAVVRNRARRWMRELLRRWQDALAPGWDLIILVRTPAIIQSYRYFVQQLKAALLLTRIAEGPLEG